MALRKTGGPAGRGSASGAAIVAGLIVLLAASVFLALCLGSVYIAPGLVWRVVAGPAPGPDAPDVVQSAAAIMQQLRLPRVLLAGLVGACLGMAGAALQGLLRNPLADPYIIGTSAGAALGATLAIVIGWTLPLAGLSPVPAAAFLCALVVMAFIYRLAFIGRRMSMDTLILAGVVVSAFLGAVIALVMYLVPDRLFTVTAWLMGSVAERTWVDLAGAWPYALFAFLGLLALAHPLNLMALGEESALHSGVPVERVKAWVVAAASLATAAAVAVSGFIGFVGLMVPHAMRRLVGPDHRLLIPASALAGAAFLICADTLARVIIPNRELPVGIITALIGAPWLCILLRRRWTA